MPREKLIDVFIDKLEFSTANVYNLNIDRKYLYHFGPLDVFYV